MRILTGIQSTGVPHLGNLLGAILPGIALSQKPGNESFFFIADLHTFTSVRDPELIRSNTYAVAASWLSCGFDTQKGFFYRQSDIPEVTELAWYLAAFINTSRLELAHSFKDKTGKGMDANAGLFFYPVLMAADILMYDAHVVPVGKDQKQHLEFTRDICAAFNRAYGEVLVMPDAEIQKEGAIVPGTDGQKMSKSYGNTINIFQNDKALRKEVMSITTDSTPLGNPLPVACTVFELYKLLASPDQVAEQAKLYESGTIGWGHAKQNLFELITTKFKTEREQYDYLMKNPDELDDRLKEGAEKAGVVAFETLMRVRDKIGYKKLAY